MHSPPHEILQLAGVDEFSKGVPGVKKEVEQEEGEGNRKTSGVCARGLDVEIDDPAGISPAKHLS